VSIGLNSLIASFSFDSWRLRLFVLLTLLAAVPSLCVDCKRRDVTSPLRQSTRRLDPRNVCITRIVPDTAKPRQKQWISRSLNLIVFEDRDAYTLWDMSNRTIRIRLLKEEEAKTIEMSDQVFARGQSQIAHTLGLVPFDEIADLPEGATWEKVADPNGAALVPGTQPYDLVWTTPISATRQMERWRFFVDPWTHLPARVEVYAQAPTEPRPQLHKTLVVSYPTDQEVRTLVRTLFPGPP
jgi:hypothetical protein